MHVRQRVENLATLRLKVGRAYDRVAVYGTAGVAAGEVRRDMDEAIQYWGPTGNWGLISTSPRAGPRARACFTR